MSDPTQPINAFETSGTSPPGAAAAASTPSLTDEERKQHRTLGLKLFDVFLYPFLTNFVVFGMSVGVTYLTRHGAARDGKLPHGKFGAVMSKRNTDLISGFESLGLNTAHAKTASMIFWSFFDGTLIAPLVKLFEDRRETIGKAIDAKLGTMPEDPRVYQAEPKQTWGTVLSGRIATAAIVLPTALAFERAGLHDNFAKWGKSTAEYMQARKPTMHATLAKKVSDLPDLFRVSYFEGIYTTVCTAGLYIMSRTFARHHDKKIGRTEPLPELRAGQGDGGSAEVVPSAPVEQPARPSPAAQVSAVQAQSRVAQKAPDAQLSA